MATVRAPLLHTQPVSRRGLQRCRASPPLCSVHIVGAGPGPADLLTVRAAELLRTAEVVIYDDLGAQAAVDTYAPASALRLFVGKRGGQPSSAKQPAIDALLVEHAATGRCVVRLKGGCLGVFSRVHSEAAALRAAGISFELVPGVSSALAAPLSAGFPLTHPQHSRSFTVTSAHDPASMDWPTLVAVDTLVMLMGGSSLETIVGCLLQHGREASTAVAVVRDGAMPSQRVWQGSLGSILQQVAGEESLSPCIIVVGGAAAAAAAEGGTADGGAGGGR